MTTQKLRVLDLFSGIGGFSLGLERAGFETAAFCEIEPYCREILQKRWPDVPIFEDVRTLDKAALKKHGISKINVICGGFPCQDISPAGKGEEPRGGTGISYLPQAFARPRSDILNFLASLCIGSDQTRSYSSARDRFMFIRRK